MFQNKNGTLRFLLITLEVWECIFTLALPASDQTQGIRQHKRIGFFCYENACLIRNTERELLCTSKPQTTSFPHFSLFSSSSSRASGRQAHCCIAAVCVCACVLLSSVLLQCLISFRRATSNESTVSHRARAKKKEVFCSANSSLHQWSIFSVQL